MKRYIAIVLVVASVAIAGLTRKTVVTGTTTQKVVVGYGAKIWVQCGTAGFRYQTALDDAGITVWTGADAGVADPYFDPGDPVPIDMPKQHNAIYLIHKDGISSFTCTVGDRS